MTPLLNLADVELPSLTATAASLPFEQRAPFVQRVAAALAAGEPSVLGAIAVAQRSYRSARRTGRVQLPMRR